MNRVTRGIGIVLIGLAALLRPLNADATCGTSLSFGGYYSTIVGTSNGPSLRANFWILDQGSPQVGVGIDNGSAIDSNGWIVGESPYWIVLGDWAPNGGPNSYDGCPNDLPNGGVTSSMVVSLSDLDVAGNMTYAVLCATRNTQTFLEYSMDFPPGCFSINCAPVTMVVAPKAIVANSVRNFGSNDVTITVASPSFAAGFYGDGSANCTPANAIPQYDVYAQQTARGVPPNPSNDAGAWVLTATCNIGSPCTLPAFTSPTNTDIYLAVSPHFNSNFTTGEAATGAPARVGVKSAKVQAGPTLAVTPRSEPVHPRGEPPSPPDPQ